MDIKDYAQMMRYHTRPRDVVPDPSTMDQEPRNMAQGGRIPFENGKKVSPNNTVKSEASYKSMKINLEKNF